MGRWESALTHYAADMSPDVVGHDLGGVIVYEDSRK
jgi:hypothetical protein